MNKTVIVGDTDESLGLFSKTIDPTAVLFSNETKQNLVVYTSVGDIGPEQFLKLLIRCEKIVYHNKPEPWSSLDTKYVTDAVIYLLYINGQADKINGFPVEKFVLLHNPLYLESLDISQFPNESFIKKICNFSTRNPQGLIAHRSSLEKQIWVAGCSYARGAWLESDSLRYGNIISKKLKLSTTNIACSKSSIDFAADQIIRSQLQKQDLVIWGLTAVNRYSWFFDDQHVNILFSEIETFPESRQRFLREMYVDDARVHLAQKNILQVNSVCEKIGCQLILIYHEALSLENHINPMKKFLQQFPGYFDINAKMIEKFGKQLDKRLNLDLGNDMAHPGPRTHNEWATMILNFLKEKNL
jgi:hypothetical protein